MASLSNINGIFDVHSTGAIQFNGNHGTAGQILRSNGNAAPTWVNVPPIVDDRYVLVTGDTMTGNLALTDATNNPSLVISTGTLTVGGVTTLNDLDVTDTLAWRVSGSDAARQRADARDDGTTFSRLHWFGKSDTAGTSNFRHAYYDGAAYINVTAASGAVTFDGILAATGGNSTEWNTSYDNSITALAVTGTTTKTLTATQQDGGTLTASWTDDNTGTVTSSAAAGYIPYMSTTTNVANSQLFYDTTNSRTILTATVGPNDDIRGSFIVRDDTPMAANVGGQIALGYKYLSSGGYTEGALIRTYKENAVDGEYGSGLKIQVRNTGPGLSTKFTLDPSGNVTIPGTYTATGGTSTEWNTAYDNSITGLAVTGTTTKTLTATQQDGGTLTASWTDNDNNTSWPNVGAGIRTNYTLGFKPPVSGYAGFYFETAAGAHAGYLLIRGGSDAGQIYKAEGITLVSDSSWMTIASRTTTDAGVRLMSGSTSAERLVIKDNGQSYFTGNLGIGVTSLSGNGGLEVTNTDGTFANANQKRVASFYDGSVNSERPGIILGYDDSSTPHGIIAARTQSGTSTIPGIQFFTYNGSSWGAKMTILSGGNVGIGTASPAMGLHVEDTKGALFGNSGASGSSYFSPSDENTLNGGYGLNTDTADIWLNYRGYQDGFTKFRDTRIGNGKGSVIVMVDGSEGNVGIGTTSPSNKLSLAGSGQNWNTSPAIKMWDSNYSKGWYVGSANNQAAGDFYIRVVATEGAYPVAANQEFTINQSGNVGIGTISPNSKLQIIANQAATDPGGKNYTGSAINTDGGDIATGRVLVQGYSNGAVDLCGINNETNRIVLYNYTDNRYLQYWDHAGSSFIPNGNVSIGSTSNGFRGERLFVDGEVRQQSTVGLNSLGAIRGGLAAYDNTTGWGAGIGGQLVLGYIYTGSSYTEGALIKMYKQNSTQGHYGSGLRWAVRENGTNLTAKMDLSPSGTLTVIQDIVAYGSPSDKKLKENIKPISLALDKVTKLQGVTFDWKESDSMLNIKEDIGFIAQDVQKVVPELVRKNSNGLLSMRHQGVVPMLVEAIKELEARVKELENK